MVHQDVERNFNMLGHRPVDPGLLLLVQSGAPFSVPVTRGWPYWRDRVKWFEKRKRQQ